jgi:hypothetical protein
MAYGGRCLEEEFGKEGRTSKRPDGKVVSQVNGTTVLCFG